MAGATLLGLALVGACGGNGASDADRGEEAVPIHEGRWEEIDGPARRARGFQNMVPVVVGDRVVVVAGVDYEQESVKALIIERGSRRWSVAGRSGVSWRFGQSVVAAGDRVILFGGCCGGGGRGSEATGLAYDVESDRWSPIAEGPLGSRHNHTSVWTGEEMIVWGGADLESARERVRSDGAAYDPDSDSWWTIAPAPLSPRERHVAVWTGEEMIIWGGSRPDRRGARLLYDGAAYDPERDRWRELGHLTSLSAPPRTRDKGANLEAIWTGEEMIIWGHASLAPLGAEGVHDSSGAVYSPARDRWELIPEPPGEIRGPRRAGTAVWSGDELLLWGGMDQRESAVTEGAAYDPEAKRWTALPEAPVDGRLAHAAIWTGKGMLVWGGFGTRHYQPNGAIYIPD